MNKLFWRLILVGLLFLAAALCLGELTSSAMFVSPVLAPRVYFPSVGITRTRAHGASVSYMSKAEACAAAQALGLKWLHGWQHDPLVCPGVESVPQVSALWQIGLPLGGNSQYVLFLNEPEEPLQSNVPDPLEAAAGLGEMLTAYPDRTIVLPSASLWYLSQMWDAGDFPADRVAANGHCYGWGYLETALTKCKDEADDLREWAIERGITEVWFNEFGYDPEWQGMDASVAFMVEMVAYYQATGVTRWAWFQTNATQGRWTSGEMGLWIDGLTPLGRAYAALRS